MNMNLAPRQIFLTRHGESINNTLHKIGGNDAVTSIFWYQLTNTGKKYAKELSKFIQEQRILFRERLDQEETHENLVAEKRSDKFLVLTSQLQRAIDTVADFDPNSFDIKVILTAKIQHVRVLNEISAGSFEG